MPSEIIIGGYGGHGSGSAGWDVVFGYGGHTAVAPRVIRADVVRTGFLCLFFNESMKQDPSFMNLANYHIAPLPGYEAFPLTLTRLIPGTDRVCFDFVGGPGAYRICAFNVRDSDDDLLIDPDHRCAVFFVKAASVEQATFIRIFDTVLGPIGLRQELIGVMNVEDLMQQRTISQGVTAQLNQVIANLAPVGTPRDSDRIPFLRLR
jgi:hypothetical protein